jgi:hypothetical protein
MKMTNVMVAIAALAISGCNPAEPTSDADEPDAVEAISDTAEAAIDAPESEPKEVPEESAKSDADNGIAVKITGFECGDNCYLDYRPLDAADDADTQSALCSVGDCEGWFSNQEMPPEYIGRTARIVLGTGKQYDNAGNVMSDDFDEVTAITVDPAE